MPGLKSSLNKNHLETKIAAVSNTEELAGTHQQARHSPAITKRSEWVYWMPFDYHHDF